METFDVRARITELIEELGMSNADLAREIGCDKRTVAYWSNHQRAFNADMLPAVCEAFGITPNQFFMLDEIKIKSKKKSLNPYALLSKFMKFDKKFLEEKLEALRKEQFLVELALRSKSEEGQILLEEAIIPPKEL